MLDGASGLIAAQRPVLMIELNEAFNPGVVARLAERYAAQSYRVLFPRKIGLKPIAEFDARTRSGRSAAADPRIRRATFSSFPRRKREAILARLA